MNRLTYDLSLLIGVAAVGIGVGLREGVGAALIVTGLLIISLTIVGALISGKR